MGLTTERADRPPFSPADAAAELRRLESARRARASREPCGARGRGARRAASARRASGTQNPGGLTRREVDVLRLAARGLDDAADRRSALHLSEDRRPPHPAHLRQDRRLDTRRRRALGHATFRRPVNSASLDDQASQATAISRASPKWRIRSSPSRPRRSTSVPSETLSTESRLNDASAAARASRGFPTRHPRRAAHRRRHEGRDITRRRPAASSGTSPQDR